MSVSISYISYYYISFAISSLSASMESGIKAIELKSELATPCLRTI